MAISGMIRTGASGESSRSRNAARRHATAAFATVAAAGLLVACGSDDVNGNGGNTDPEAASEATESSESVDGSGDYTGWADMEEAVADLSGQGIECVVPELEGLEGFAACQPDGMLSFDMTLADFEDVMQQDVTQGEAITLVSDGGDWTFTCDSTDATVCEEVAEYTGGDVMTLS